MSLAAVIAKVISGAQNGVDFAALCAAEKRGVPTGGTMAKGCETLDGPKPEWATRFGLVECATFGYPSRTRANVRDADVTVRIARTFLSPGETCTMRAIVDFAKPHYDVHVTRLRSAQPVVQNLAGAVLFLREQAAKLGRPLVVNFAGNSEQTAPGIEAFAERVIENLFDVLDAPPLTVSQIQRRIVELLVATEVPLRRGDLASLQSFRDVSVSTINEALHGLIACGMLHEVDGAVWWRI